jgi:hypothetical protein
MSEAIPPSDEVMNEEEREQERRKLDEEAKVNQKTLRAELEQAEADALAANIADHNERVQAAREFDWDAWEKETGLTRPDMEEPIENA